jgi:hypothetical protein
MSEEIVKCTYKYCSHIDKNLPLNEAILVGKSAYYHQKCNKENEEIKEIINLFKTQIDPYVVFSQLRNVINNIVYDKCLGTEYLLFALNFAIKNKINLKHAMGLHYIVGYENIQNAYKKIKADLIRSNMSNTSNINNDVEFTTKPTVINGFGSVLKGGN